MTVGTVIDSCKTSLGIGLQFWVLGELEDPSHTGIFGDLENYEARIAHTLAMSVGEDNVHRVGN